MNEELARKVALVRAIETADAKREVLSEDDRMYATRSARELAQWQAAESRTAVTSEHFLQQRAEQILKRLGERSPAFSAFLQRRGIGPAVTLGVPLLALAVGALADRIGDPHRVDLLSAPLLTIVGWNLLVYLFLLAAPLLRRGKDVSPLLRRASVGAAALPRKLPHALAAGVTAFMAEWSVLSARLTGARLARVFHLAAAMFGLGAVLSLYARGLLTQYVAGWESTFLDAAQVHAILSLLFAPALMLLPLQGFTLADIQALRFGAAPALAGGARWVHLYAATLVLLVVAPRLLLAAFAHWRVRRMAARIPLDLEQPYFRNLGTAAGTAAPTVLRVLPYSFTLDEARDRGLAAVAVALLGEQTRLMLRPSAAYGDEVLDALGGADLNDPAIGATAVLFNLAATPEAENHGAFLGHLVRQSSRPVLALLDESAFAERMGDEARVAERVALWQQFCAYHKARALVVNLLYPERRPLEGAVL